MLQPAKRLSCGLKKGNNSAANAQPQGKEHSLKFRIPYSKYDVGFMIY